jgi:CDP-paratose 2-epimerase
MAEEARVVKVLVTGACGFVGSTLIREWLGSSEHEFVGLDNLARPGSEVNRLTLKRLGVRVLHGDVRCASDLDTLPAVDVVLETAANPSVLAGADGRASSRQLVEHNLIGTVNALEYCRRHRAAFVLLSTSRVYSISVLAGFPLRVADGAFEPDAASPLPGELTAAGVREDFSTAPPISLYGATKLASERLALEYGMIYGFPVWINRCGVLAGGGQFGRPDQGIFSYWINSWLHRRPLSYIGFGGGGHQVRDCLHPADLVPLLERQIVSVNDDHPRVVNVGGGRTSAISLWQLSEWCRERLGDHVVTSRPETRPFDVPWLVLDTSRATKAWDWKPSRATRDILEEIVRHAERHPEWLDLSDCF